MGLPFQLLVVTDDGPDLLARAEAALSGAGAGRVALLLRNKQAGTSTLVQLAKSLRSLTHDRGASLLVSDRVDVALLVEADGVHLPESGFGVDEARALLGPGRLIGVSRHTKEGLDRAQHAGADYATLSPVFASPHKGVPLGMAHFAHVARQAKLPVFALGGVRVQHVPALVQAGAAGVAVIREVMSAQDPGAAVLQLLRALDESESASNRHFPE